MEFTARHMSGLEQVAQDNQLFALGSRVVVRGVKPFFRQTDMILRLIPCHAGKGLRQNILAFGVQQRIQHTGMGFRGIILNLQAAEETGTADRLAFTGVGGEKDVWRTERFIKW